MNPREAVLSSAHPEPLEPERGFRPGIRFVSLSPLVLIIFAGLGGPAKHSR